MSYVYIRSEPGLWTVGHYDGGEWEPESDHMNEDKAAKRVHFLNGGTDDLLKKRIAELETAKADSDLLAALNAELLETLKAIAGAAIVPPLMSEQARQMMLWQTTASATIAKAEGK